MRPTAADDPDAARAAVAKAAAAGHPFPLVLVDAVVGGADGFEMAAGLTQSGAVGAVGYSPDGGLFAVSRGTSIHVFNTRTFRERLRLDGHASRVRALAFDPQGRTLVSGAVSSTRGRNGGSSRAPRASSSSPPTGGASPSGTTTRSSIWRRARRSLSTIPAYAPWP